METRKQRFISATLLGIAVPCMAQIAMISGILGGHGLTPLPHSVFGLGHDLYRIRFVVKLEHWGHESGDISRDPAIQKAQRVALLKKVWMRVRWFLKEALPWLFLGVVVVNVLYSVGVLDNKLGEAAAPFMESWFGLPGAASLALLIGFLRKDLAVGMLLPLGMGAMQLVIAVTILVIYFPRVATFAVLARELGWRDMLKSTMMMIGVALLVGGLMRVILLGV